MTREEAVIVLKAFMGNPLFSDVHKQAFNIAINDIKQRHDCDINNLILINKDNYELTTKNDLGVENDLVSSIIEKISEKVTETHEEFIFETIRPYCENVVQMKITKRDLERALLKYYGKNDLGVDCISRADAIKAMQDKAKKLTNEDTINGLCGAVAILFDLPPVTTIRPTGHWELVQRGKSIDVCCSNCKAIRIKGYAYNYTIDQLDKEDVEECFKCADMRYCPNCGAKMFEPKESEESDADSY